MKKFLNKISFFLRRIFRLDNNIKSLPSENEKIENKNIENKVEDKSGLITELKQGVKEMRKIPIIETPVCVGDGTGVNDNISF